MPTSQHRVLLNKKLAYSMAHFPIRGFPTDLSAKLAKLNHLISNQDKIRKNRLNSAVNPLLDRLYLLSLYLFDPKTASTDQEKIKTAEQIIECVELLETIIEDKKQSQNAVYELQKKLQRGAFELRAHKSVWKHLPLAAIDATMNGLNTARSFIFQTAYPRSRLSSQDFIAEELHRFTLYAEQSSTRKALCSLLPQEQSLTVHAREGLAVTPHLAARINKLYHQFYNTHRNQKNLIAEMNLLLRALDTFAEQVILAKNNDVLNTISEKAFLACQDLVMELLTEKQPSMQRIQRLTTCFEQTVRVIKNPGQKEEVYNLQKLVEESDYKRVYCDKERTAYAVIHILVSVILLTLAIIEAAVLQSVSMAVSFWTLSAEVGSVGVGIGQLRYYANSEVKNTLFSESMGVLSTAARNKTAPGDWNHLSDINQRRQELLNDLRQRKFNTDSELDNEVKALLGSLNEFRAHLRETDASMINTQALAVLRSGEDLAIDMLRSDSPSLKRIQKLRECVLAADQIVINPGDDAAIHHLVDLVSKGDYETRRLIKRDVFIGVLLALASIALFAITITGTIFSAGATAGTILSPFMLSIMAINKLVHCSHREKTLFSDEAKALTEFAQLEENTYTNARLGSM